MRTICDANYGFCRTFKMNIASIGVTGFVSDRKTDVEFLKLLQSQEFQLNTDKKRCIERIRYRTRSFQPRKVRRVVLKTNVAEKVKNRRQRRHSLESNTIDSRSYVWSVKRMFMAKINNSNISVSSRKFGYKAVERFANQRCVLHDISYYKCFILKSSIMLDVLSQFMVCCIVTTFHS